MYTKESHDKVCFASKTDKNEMTFALTASKFSPPLLALSVSVNSYKEAPYAYFTD